MKKILSGFMVFITFAACGCAQNPPVFDGARAFAILEKQCEFGARVPGTPAHQKCRDYLITALRGYADQVTTQEFLHTFGKPPQSARATNIIANFQPARRDRVLLCAHWDCRHICDEDPDPKKRTLPVMGANDGASGVAVLLEIARLLKARPPRQGVDIVLFDAEDQGMQGDDRSYARGSQYFARHVEPTYHPRYGILLDMIGDKDLLIYQEAFSVQMARPIVDKVWAAAQRLGISEFVPQVGYAVFDDHVPLLERGIACIDVIDFDYPHWHTSHDTPDKCSAASLEKVGRVVVEVLYNP